MCPKWEIWSVFLHNLRYFSEKSLKICPKGVHFSRSSDAFAQSALCCRLRPICPLLPPSPNFAEGSRWVHLTFRVDFLVFHVYIWGPTYTLFLAQHRVPTNVPQVAMDVNMNQRLLRLTKIDTKCQNVSKMSTKWEMSRLLPSYMSNKGTNERSPTCHGRQHETKIDTKCQNVSKMRFCEYLRICMFLQRD